jgi:hypothetical protein
MYSSVNWFCWLCFFSKRRWEPFFAFNKAWQYICFFSLRLGSQNDAPAFFRFLFPVVLKATSAAYRLPWYSLLTIVTKHTAIRFNNIINLLLWLYCRLLWIPRWIMAWWLRIVEYFSRLFDVPKAVLSARHNWLAFLVCLCTGWHRLVKKWCRL